MDEAQLSAALQKADAAGNVEDAKALAGAIRKLRATRPAVQETVETPTQGSQNQPEVKPPEESLGSKASRFIQGALTGGHTFDDLGRGLGVIKDNPGKLADLAEQQVRSATAPVGGDTIAAAGAAAAGKGFDPAAQRERRQALEAEMGTAATMIPKALGGVGGFGRVPGGPAVQGAVGGAAAGVNESGDMSKAPQDAALGALGGKLAEGVARAGGAVIDRIATRDIPKAVRALADRLQIRPQELVANRQALMQATGRNDVSWAEAADPATVERLRGMALARQPMSEEAGLAREAADAARPANMANFAENRGMTGTPAAARATRTADMNRTMTQHGDTPVTIQNPEDFDRRAVTRGLRTISENSPPALRQTLDDFRTAIGTGGGPVQIRLRDVENVRQAVADAITRDPALTEVLGPVSRQLRALGEQIPAYRRSMRNFENLGDFATGMEQGGAAAAPKAATTSLEEAARNATPAGVNGQRAGFRSRLVDDLKNGQGEAPVKYMTPGFQERADIAMGRAESDRLQRGFASETRAARNLARLDTSPGADADPLSNVKLLASGVRAAKTGIGVPDLITKTWGRLRSLGLSNNAARDLSRSLFSQDPVQNNIAAQHLLRLGVIQDAKDIAGARAALVGAQATVAAAEE